MTDWNRVEKLRQKGTDWKDIAEDDRVGFHVSSGANPGRELKVLYFQRRSRTKAKGRTPKEAAQRQRTNLGWSRGRLAVLGGVVVVVAIVALLVIQGGPNSAGPGNWVGRSAPDFTLRATNGQSFTLSQEKGKMNTLLFFNEGLSCSPCLAQMVQLDHDAAEFRGMNVQVVQITGDSLSDMTSWAQNNQISSTLILADPSLGVCNAYQTTGSSVSMMPGTAPGHTFVLVNETGFVAWRHDYGPSDMSVPDSEVVQAVNAALGH